MKVLSGGFVMKCGLLGRHLAHSYSPQIHSMLGEYSYELFEKEPEEIEDFLKSGQWDGLNVTVPYKKAVIPFLDELSPVAERLGAVNTVVRRNGKLIGHNTDYYGFKMLLETLPMPFYLQKCLVLGSGGASNTAAAVLRDEGANVIIISRSGENNYDNLHLHKDADLIVNTTPVGMYPNNGISPVPNVADLSIFPCLRGVIDLIYNPARTKLLLDAEAKYDDEYRWFNFRNGLLMLVAQAKEAAEWFTGTTISEDVIEPIMDRMEYDMLNVVLIGMPGSGKTTVGKLLSQKTGRRFVDADVEIVKLAGKSIPDIFSQDGEEAFRDLETRVLAELGKQSGLIIATGGGCVTKERNFNLLHQNGEIFWIRRKLEDLPTDGRPLSQQTDLQEMYRIRKPLYDRWNDWFINNYDSPDDAVLQIMNVLEYDT